MENRGNCHKLIPWNYAAMQIKDMHPPAKYK
jgi:hypothetical protein